MDRPRFKIVQVENRPEASPDTVTLAARSGAAAAPALFFIEIDRERAEGKAEGRVVPGLAFSKGRFRHVAGSAPGPLLAKVAKAMGAKGPRPAPAKTDVLPFQIGFLGANLSRDPMGRFSGKPSGDWVATKLFLAGGTAEVYFNFEIETGDAEFSAKDESYGGAIVEALSKVLW